MSPGYGAGRAVFAAILTVSLAACGSDPETSPTAAATFPPPTRANTPTATMTATATDLLPTPAATATETPPPYVIEPVTPEQGLGIVQLKLISQDVETPIIEPDDLRLPSPTLVPDTGRFGVIHYTLDLIHLGSDFLNPPNDPLLSPHEEAILVGLGYLRRSTYVAIALDLSGEFQMYLVRLATDEGPKAYIIAYAHLENGSNDNALAQAEANEGRVETMGRISRVGPDDPNLSDMHIAALDMAAVLDFADTRTYHEGLARLFTDELPRDNQQYPSIFARPEDVFPALESLVAADGRW